MALIGISGYAGSGKDTVGLIIQWLTALDKYPEYTPSDFRDYIAQHKGKDRPLLHYEQGPGAFYTPFEIKKWAGKLKVVASILTGIPVEKFEDQEFKKTYLPEQWSYWTISVIDNGKLLFQHGRYNTKQEAEEFVPFLKENYGEFRMEYAVGMQQITVRQFLQELGTDALRNGLHPNTWVNALMADYKRGPFFPDVPAEDHAKFPNWIITDTRFPNEAQAIKNAGGIIIRVKHPDIKPVNAHPSETGLDDYHFDHEIVNLQQGYDPLIAEVKSILENHQML